MPDWLPDWFPTMILFVITGGIALAWMIATGGLKLELVLTFLASLVVVPVVFTITAVLSYNIALPLLDSFIRAFDRWNYYRNFKGEFLNVFVVWMVLPFTSSVEAVKLVNVKIKEVL